MTEITEGYYRDGAGELHRQHDVYGGPHDEAPPAEDDQEQAHLHSWVVLGAQPYTPYVMLGKPTPHTIVLIRCSACGEPDTRTLPGTWIVPDLQIEGLR
jgi:hypothetical protein